RMERPLNVPQNLSRPRPPILIAGGGERRTLPLVAKYADACNVPPGPELPRKLELLKRLCDEAGRDYEAIEKTVPFAFDVGPDGAKVGELIHHLRGLAAMGAQTVLGWVVGQERITPIEVMGREVIPAVAALSRRGALPIVDRPRAARAERGPLQLSPRTKPRASKLKRSILT